MLALIDGDALVFSSGFANEKSKDGQLITVNPEHFAFKTVKDTIDRILVATKADDYKIYIGDREKSNFRYTVDPNYKANRKGQKRPEHEVAIREYLIRHHNAIEVKGMEVDDALGIEQMLFIKDTTFKIWYASDVDNVRGCTNNDRKEVANHTIICSNDKDLDMIPGWHYDLDFGKSRRGANGNTYKIKAYKRKPIYFITDPGFIDLRTNESNGRKIICGGGYLWFCAQLLLGDSTDNIPKLAEGYGPVKVYDILKDCRTSEEGIRVVYNEFEKVNIHLTLKETQTKLMTVAKLLWIKRQIKDDIIFPRRWL